MKIGVDAKWFFKGPISGKVVITNLVREIIAANSSHEIYILLDKKYRNEPFPFTGHNIHLEYVWNGNNLLSNVFVLPFALRKLNLDIVIFQNFSPLISNFKRYAFIHDVIFKTHPEYYTWKERLYFFPLRFLTMFAHGICTVSNAEKKRMSALNYGTSDTIDVVYHGAANFFTPLDSKNPTYLQEIRLKYKLPDKFLLYVGRLNSRKNIFNLLRGYAHSCRSLPLVIVGSYDWKMTNVDCLITELGINGNLHFTGAVYNEELAAIFCMAVAFCFPSYQESFGLPALEAMSSGVPALVSTSSSLPEICGEAGTYVDPDSPNDIADKLDLLMNDPDYRLRKSALGLEQAQKFSWAKSARDLIGYAEQTVRRSRG